MDMEKIPPDCGKLDISELANPILTETYLASAYPKKQQSCF
jgi:hypothetical protein